MPVAEEAGLRKCPEIGRNVQKYENSVWCYVREEMRVQCQVGKRVIPGDVDAKTVFAKRS